jgi:hypothetical protein
VWVCSLIIVPGAIFVEFEIFVDAGLYPKFMYVNRGNHEAKDMNRAYGFEGEVKQKHGEQAYKACH